LSSDAAGGDGTTGPGGLLNAIGDIRNTVPLLGPLQDNGGSTWTHALLPGSPAIDAGDDSVLALLPTDQCGCPRMFGVHVDIGAYEAQFPNVKSPCLTGFTRLVDGTIHFSFTNAAGAAFCVLTSTNISLPASDWTVLPLNCLIESPPGFYQLTDPSATNAPERYYRVRWP
jgi:hypothetical protein